MSLPGWPFSAMAGDVYPMVQATETSRIHSHRRVVSSLRNSAATSRVMTGHLPAAACPGRGEGQEDLLQPAVARGELAERPGPDQPAAADDHHLLGELLDLGERVA